MENEELRDTILNKARDAAHKYGYQDRKRCEELPLGDIDKAFVEDMHGEGYSEMTKVDGKGWCGIMRMVFTTGVVVGMDALGYFGRYCFGTKKEASDALKDWDGKEDIGGEWIKWKGVDGERKRI